MAKLILSTLVRGYNTVCLEHNGACPFSQFYRKREKIFEHGPVNHTTVIHIIHCSCYNYKIPDHLLTASASEFTKD